MPNGLFDRSGIDPNAARWYRFSSTQEPTNHGQTNILLSNKPMHRSRRDNLDIERVHGAHMIADNYRTLVWWQVPSTYDSSAPHDAIKQKAGKIQNALRERKWTTINGNPDPCDQRQCESQQCYARNDRLTPLICAYRGRDAITDANRVGTNGSVLFQLTVARIATAGRPESRQRQLSESTYPHG